MNNAINTSKFLSGDRVEATDKYGNFNKAQGTVVDFKLNGFKRLLVGVRLDCGSGRCTSCFYAGELTLLERPAPPIPR